MRKLFLGNEAVARGLYEAGCRVASSYPGTPSTEVTESAAKYDEIYCEWAPNEKVAMETAGGAAIAGARSFCGMKHVGLNVAADPLFTLSYTGVNAGMVIVVADDPGMHSSQNEQDSRNYAKASKIPMLEPADSQECLSFTKLAYDISERYDTPVIIRLTTRISHSRSLVEVGERVDDGLKNSILGILLGNTGIGHAFKADLRSQRKNIRSVRHCFSPYNFPPINIFCSLGLSIVYIMKLCTLSIIWRWY